MSFTQLEQVVLHTFDVKDVDGLLNFIFRVSGAKSQIASFIVLIGWGFYHWY